MMAPDDGGAAGRKRQRDEEDEACGGKKDGEEEADGEEDDSEEDDGQEEEEGDWDDDQDGEDEEEEGDESEDALEAPPHVIPGLSAQAVRGARGSSRLCQTPQMVSFKRYDDGAVSVAWSAPPSNAGTPPYRVEASAPAELSGGTLAELDVSCSCPDFAQRANFAGAAGWRGLCKHASASLLQVVDAAAEQRRAALECECAQRHARVRRQQADALPGERERLEYGLSKMSASDVLAALREHMASSVDGLRDVARVLPPSVLPSQATATCRRCGKAVDPGYTSDLVCRVAHPEDCVVRTWKDRDGASFECSQCGKAWSSESYCYYGFASPAADEECCFVGRHEL